MPRYTLSVALIGLLTLISVESALAQRAGRLSPEEMQERMVAQTDETIVGLALDGDRAETVKAILLAQGEKQFELRQGVRRRRGDQGQQGQGRAGMQEFRDKIEALRLETASLLSDVLTDEEMEKFQEIVASRADQGRRRRGSSQI